MSAPDLLVAQGITGLYTHQAETWEALRGGGNAIVTTSTASGKSLAFNLPVLDLLARERLAELAALGTSCPDHFLRTKVKPLVVDLPSLATVEEISARLVELHAAYREDYQGYYDRNATPDSPEELADKVRAARG